MWMSTQVSFQLIRWETLIICIISTDWNCTSMKNCRLIIFRFIDSVFWLLSMRKVLTVLHVLHLDQVSETFLLRGSVQGSPFCVNKTMICLYSICQQIHHIITMCYLFLRAPRTIQQTFWIYFNKISRICVSQLLTWLFLFWLTSYFLGKQKVHFQIIF